MTRNGRPAIVLISTDDLEQLEETIDVLSDPEAMRSNNRTWCAMTRCGNRHKVRQQRARRAIDGVVDRPLLVGLR